MSYSGKDLLENKARRRRNGKLKAGAQAKANGIAANFMNRAYGETAPTRDLVVPGYENPSYSNKDGSGDRPDLYASISSSGASFGAHFVHSDGLVNGDRADNNGYLEDGIAVAGAWLQFDFTTKRIITEMTAYFTTGFSPNGTWQVQGYDGSVWVDIGSTFVLGTALTQIIPMPNKIAYTKYRWVGKSGVSSFNLYYWAEIEFCIGNST